jgi:hypothetical protein
LWPAENDDGDNVAEEAEETDGAKEDAVHDELKALAD